MTNLIAFYDKITCSADLVWQQVIVYLDFSKAFVVVPTESVENLMIG